MKKIASMFQDEKVRDTVLVTLILAAIIAISLAI
jgi:hypothetical protein